MLSTLFGVLALIFAAANPNDRTEAAGAGALALPPQCTNGAHTTISPCGTNRTVPQSSTRSVPFTVTNTDPAGEEYDLACSFTSPVTSCSVSPGLLLIQGAGSGNATVTFSVNSTLATGSVTLTATSTATSDWATGKYNIIVDDSTRISPIVSTTPHNGENRNVGFCATNCNDAVLAYTTPPYFTLDQPRAVSLVYRSGQAWPMGMIQVDVTDNSSNPADKMSLRLLKPDQSYVTFVNGSQEMFFQSVAGTSRLAALFDANTVPTGAYNYTAIVTSLWNTGFQRQTSVPIRVLIVNEKNSIYGSGWSVAGLQRLYFHSDSILISEGDGSMSIFRRTGCPNVCNYASPGGDYSKLIKRYNSPDSALYDRWYKDSSRVAFLADGRATYADDRLGNRTEFTYDPSLRLSMVTDPMLKYILLGYEVAGGTWKAGTLRWIEDSAGRRIWFGVNAANDLQEIVDIGPVAALRPTYDALHRVTSFLDAGSNRYAIEYDYTRKVKRDTLPAILVDGQSVKPVIEFRPIERSILVDEASGYGTSTNPAPRVKPDTLAARVTDPEGNTTRYTVNSWGQELVVTDPLGNVTTIDRSGSIFPTTITYPTGAADVFGYDGPLVNYIQLSGKDPTNIHYGLYGQPDSVWGPNQAKVRFFLGLRGRVDKSVVVGTTDTVRYSYVTRHRVDSIIDRGAHVTKFSYDATFGNLDSTRAPGNRWTRLGFDPWGRVSWSSASGRARRWVQYDTLNRARKAWTEGLSPADTVRVFYSQLFADSVKDANGSVYRTEYNALGWPTRAYDPDPAYGSMTYGYFKNGWVKNWTNRRGQAVNFSYDVIGRVVKKWGTNTVSDSFSYTPNGLQVVGLNAVSRDEIYSRASGWVDSVVTTIAGQRYRIFYRPDSRLRLDSMDVMSPVGGISFAGRRQSYSTSTGLLDWVRVNGLQTSFRYNNEWQRDTTIYPGNYRRNQRYTTIHDTYLSAFDTYDPNRYFRRGYGSDSIGRVNVMDRPKGSYSLYEISQFKYDGKGRLQGFIAYDSTSYCFANIDYGAQCTRSVPTNITYDAGGNALTFGSESGTYSSLGSRILSWSGLTFTHDVDGNRTSKSSPSTTYGWSAEGRLTTVVQGATTLTYDYNAFGQLVRRQRNGTTERHFLWDGDQLLAELDGAATQRVAEYSYLPGIDRPFALVTGPTSIGNVRYFEQDDLGNIAGVFKDSIVYQTLVFSPKGVLASFTGTLADTNRLRFKGLVWEGDITQLHYARNRWYDGATGRFVTEDPIGLEGGVNLYTFAANDPVNLFDPDGLCPMVWQPSGDPAPPAKPGETGVYNGVIYTCGCDLKWHSGDVAPTCDTPDLGDDRSATAGSGGPASQSARKQAKTKIRACPISLTPAEQRAAADAQRRVRIAAQAKLNMEMGAWTFASGRFARVSTRTATFRTLGTAAIPAPAGSVSLVHYHLRGNPAYDFGYGSLSADDTAYARQEGLDRIIAVSIDSVSGASVGGPIVTCPK